MFDELALCLLLQWNLWGFRSKLSTTGCHFIKTVPLLRRQSGAQSSVQFYMRSWPRFLHTIEPLETYVHTHSAVTHKQTFVSPNCDNYTPKYTVCIQLIHTAVYHALTITSTHMVKFYSLYGLTFLSLSVLAHILPSHTSKANQ